jgi:hypothetical protein
VTSCREISRVGFLHLTLGKITTLRADLGTLARRGGFSKAMFSQNGRCLERVRFCGLMANVRGRPAYLLSQKLMAFLIVAGAGKSVLWYVPLSIFMSRRLIALSSSSIIEAVDRMRKLGFALLAFYYCDFREDQKKDLRGLLSSFLVQLCHQSDSCSDALSNLYLEHSNGSRQPNDDELIKCLEEILQLPGQAPVYLIIDALDECPITSSLPSPREKVLKLVEDLIDPQIPNLRVCVTSRPETDIKVVLDPLTFHSISLHDEIGQMKDIEDYIRSIVNRDRMMRRWNAVDKQLVIETLTKKADGM